MSGYNKRKREEDIANASDPDDSDFDISETRARPAKKPAKTHSRSARKKKSRRRQGSDDDDDISDDDDLDEESYESSAPPSPIETGPSGRPLRGAAKKSVTYEESEDEEVPDLDEIEDEIEDDEDVKPLKKKSKIVKLKPIPPEAFPRSTRARSAGVKSRGSEPPQAGPRRTRTRGDFEDDTLLALTNSGHHAMDVRTGRTMSPEVKSGRATRGGKGLKKPANDPIDEDEEEAGVEAVMDDVEDILQEAAAEQGVTIEDADMAGDESEQPADDDEEDDEDDEDVPVRKTRRGSTRTGQEIALVPEPIETESTRRSLRRGARPEPKKSANDQGSDFEPPEDDDEDNLSQSDKDGESPRKGGRGQYDSESGAGGRKGKSKSRGRNSQSSSDEPDPDEILDELEDLNPKRSRRKGVSRRELSRLAFDAGPSLRERQSKPDYRVFRSELANVDDAEIEQAATPSRRRTGNGGGGGSGWPRTLFSTAGPFGGVGGPAPLFGGPEGYGAAGGVDSDSSEDERIRPGGVSAVPNRHPHPPTPSSAFPKGAPQPVGADPSGAGKDNLGLVKSRQALADADPLGVDPNVNFDSIGGLKDHINQLKEMVTLPLLYPEIFQRFKVTPPRGVLFHGPPGTGKTLLARALAASCSSEGRKITFYMRKGADALSKWVGEAERQLRLLFDEARKNQPSIIFFDEIDGLAPVRSSKQEQIHASIVSTLLALMDGMDGRGQVIVIGATNRPDSIDPALRRPGRFDREFYFPLPDIEARKAIIDINTKNWNPPLDDTFKMSLAELTKGYGGADLRALSTEAALNAVQRRYPQIYSSNEKLIIDPATITVTATDFMISVKKIVPSSERSSSSGATALPTMIEPLLRVPLAQIKDILGNILPKKKKTTALEEALYEEYKDADGGFQREKLQTGKF
jgi:ATPase family AAA domain-containing protein 2